jgi:hypothetical protein
MLPTRKWRRHRNWGARVHEVTVGGVPAVVLENERLRLTVLTGKGTDLVELNDKRNDRDYVWLSPAGVRAPADVAGGAGDDVAAFLDTYPGGWQEVLPNGGAPSRYRGAALAQHGEVANLPWDHAIVTDDADEVAVRFTVEARRMPLRLAKTMRLRRGEGRFTVDEELTNLAPVPLDLMWGHHVTFGAPFLRPGCRIRLPDGISVIPHKSSIDPQGRRRTAAGGPHRWPLVPADGGGTLDLSVAPEPGGPSDIVYLTGFADTGWYEVSDADGGFRVEWDARVMPYLWMWQELGATVDHPWWGRAYVIGLEPFSSYPTDGLAAAVEGGTALRLAAGERLAFRLAAGIIDGDGDG